MKKSILAVILILSLFSACTQNSEAVVVPSTETATQTAVTVNTTNTHEIDSNILEFTAANPEITVTKAGNYVVTGSTTNGRLVINAGDEAVTLTLQDVSIESETGSAIRVRSAGSVEIILPEQSNSVLISSVRDDDNSEAISSNSDLTISGGGGLTLTSNGNGIHSDRTFTMNGGTVMINRAEEGIEAATINITGGSIAITAFEDGINVSDGAYNADSYNQSGGRVYINAAGDGLDSNNEINITGGTLIIEGPTARDNAAIDYDRAFNIDGGTVIAVGSRGMNVYPTSGTQTFIGANIAANAGDTVIARDAAGNEIAAIVLSKKVENVFISTSALVKGETVNIYVSEDSGERFAQTAVAGEAPQIGFQGSTFGDGQPPQFPFGFDDDRFDDDDRYDD
ncbi:MAG: carbohydrate-binding domain-containing protein [Ruminococcus sp.]|jgi:hypothetical protein|nr:carbohydrate-binding domain-containing protein [Ruminococcus sp.]